MNYIISEQELHISHLALIVTKNNSFVCVVVEDKKSYLTPAFLCSYHGCRSNIFFCFYGICVFNAHFTKLTKLCHVATAVFLFANVSDKTTSRSCICFLSTMAKYTHSNIWVKILIQERQVSYSQHSVSLIFTYLAYFSHDMGHSASCQSNSCFSSKAVGSVCYHGPGWPEDFILMGR